MKNWTIIFSISIMLSSCFEGGFNANEHQGKSLPGGAYRGGVFRMNEVEDFRNLFPHSITEVSSYRIATQIYEGLVRFDPKTLEILPSIAESWTVNENATLFTFKIRKGVYFQDNMCFSGGKGREVNARDFEYAFTNLCTASPENKLFWLFGDKVVGAKAYFKSTLNNEPLKKGVSGIRVLDDYTLEIELNYSFSGFENILAHYGCWVYPMEAFKHYGKDMRTQCVGTGPFNIKALREGETCILERNPNYWRRDEYNNQLPYLDAVKFSFLKEKKSELLEFRKGNLDMIFQLPLEMIDNVMGELEDAKNGGNIDFEMQVVPAMNVQYYGFQHQSELFKSKFVRLAFNHAIDRNAIVKFTLQGEGIPAFNGIVPPAFKNYHADSVKGYHFDPDLARSYLVKAGYKGGKGFPKVTLQINSGGSNNIQVAEVIQNMLKENLNIDVHLSVVPYAQHFQSIENGETMFWRSGWIADYPDPENFLNLLYGRHVPESMEEKSYINSIRYVSEAFDQTFEEALSTVDETERYRLYRKAEQIAINDGAIMPLFYEEFTRLVNTKVKNLHPNAMEFRDLSEVYFIND